ncbi:MAG: DUF4922 domain-containing protein [Gammaproteobacteria bacterium]|nr:DUF4922 domain-containing protein [Gammaproteobacteria bacterium]
MSATQLPLMGKKTASTSPAPLEPGTLWKRLTKCVERARQSGALQPIDTERRLLDDHGVTFVVHIAPRLTRKDAAAQRPGRDRTDGRGTDPFLPPESDLTVARVSETHVALLNKFNVIDNHLLIITRDFKEQETVLELSDFRALWTCMSEFDALGFYNSGPGAGSSQPHKHLQMVPLPLSGSASRTPMDALIAAAGPSATASAVPGIPFTHVYSPLRLSTPDDPEIAAVEALACYRNLLAQASVRSEPAADSVRVPTPYNLLVTRHWMMLVPRRREHYEHISVNALGFVGSLFVRDDSQLQTLLEHGPMKILRAVSGH